MNVPNGVPSARPNSSDHRRNQWNRQGDRPGYSSGGADAHIEDDGAALAEQGESLLKSEELAFGVNGEQVVVGGLVDGLYRLWPRDSGVEKENVAARSRLQPVTALTLTG